MSKLELPEELPESSHKRIGLQVDIVNELIDACSVPGTPNIGPILVAKINELKVLLENDKKAAQPPIKKDWAILATFATKILTENEAQIIKNVSFILYPATGYVSWWNDTVDYVRVRTFDETDALRWIPYEERVIAPNQVVRLTARGNFIHIHTTSNNATYDCDKGQAYRFDGQNVEPKLG